MRRPPSGSATSCCRSSAASSPCSSSSGSSGRSTSSTTSICSPAAGAGTEVVSVRIFNHLTGRGDIGASAALSLVLAALLCVLLFVYFRRTSRGECHAVSGSSRPLTGPRGRRDPHPARAVVGRRRLLPRRDHRPVRLWVHALHPDDRERRGRSGGADSSAQFHHLRDVREVLRSVEEGGQGFVVFMRNSAVIATVAVAVSLRVAIPGAYAISATAVLRPAHDQRRCSWPSTCSRRSCWRSRCS